MGILRSVFFVILVTMAFIIQPNAAKEHCIWTKRHSIFQSDRCPENYTVAEWKFCNYPFTKQERCCIQLPDDAIEDEDE